MKNEYEVRGNVTVVHVREKETVFECFIDTSMLDIVSQYSWWARTSGIKQKRTCVYSKIKQKHIVLHRLLTNAPSGLVVDHINHNPLDNRLENLRVVTHAENLQNLSMQSLRNKTGIRGLTWHSGSWRVNSNKKTYFFDEQDQALRFLSISRAIELPFSIEARCVTPTAEDIEFYECINNRGRRWVASKHNKTSRVKGIHFSSRDGIWVVKLRIKGQTVFERGSKSFDNAIEMLNTARKQYGIDS